jgi:hypothetical protein
MVGGLILASALRFGTVHASTGDSGIPKPSVPEFTVNLIGYDRIEVKIKNQPFTPYWTQENNYNGTINLFYNIRCKWPSAENWTYLCGGGLEGYAVREILMQDYGSEYTVLSYETSHSPIDFQVEAVIGYEQSVLSPPPFPMTRWVIIGESSGWSDTQTITISESQTPTSPETTPTPTAPNMGPTSPPSQEPALTQEQLETIIGMAIVAIVLGAAFGLLIYFKKPNARQNNHE